MTPKTSAYQQTFIARAFSAYREKVARRFSGANALRQRSAETVQTAVGDLTEWMGEYKFPLIVFLAVLIWFGLTLWFIADWLAGGIEGNAVQTGLGGGVGGTVVALIVSPFAALGIFLIMLLGLLLFNIIVPIVLFLPLVLWTSIYVLWPTFTILAKMFLLVPLALLFLATRLVQLWRRIFYTCPSRSCTYRGYPDHECPKCGKPNSFLWPNFYGLLWHHCVQCDERLPTLAILGRRKLKRRCGSCAMPLLGRHGGQYPERLVAIVGGVSSGKTCYLTMAVNAVAKGRGKKTVPINGEIDDESQEKQFREDWRKIEMGVPPAKTAEVAHAFLLHTKMGRSKFQLYLYDAPGEEFEIISKMTKQQYFPLLEGFVILADPVALKEEGKRRGDKQSQYASFQDVVNSTTALALSGIGAEHGGKITMRVAVVVNKIDTMSGKKEGKQIAAKDIPAASCRKQLMIWGVGNAVRTLENHFESVDYFACSTLGRDVDSADRQPFRSDGVLEPLYWLLTGKRNGIKSHTKREEQGAQ